MMARLQLTPRRGFSLIEVMVSSVLFLVGVAGVVTAVSTAANIRSQARLQGLAAEIAEEQIELLLAAGRDSPDLTTGSLHSERRAEDGSLLAGGPFVVEWEVNTLAAVPSVSRLVVDVRWVNHLGQDRSLRLETNRD